MSKDIWINEHEKLVDEYLERHPSASWEQAYNRTAQYVDDRVAERYADMIDEARMRAKEDAYE